MPFVLENTPSTVGELIKEAVHNCVFEYNERVKKGEDAAPLSSDEISKMNEIHKMILAKTAMNFPRWLWIWILIIAVIKITSIISGFVCKKRFIAKASKG